MIQHDIKALWDFAWQTINWKNDHTTQRIVLDSSLYEIKPFGDLFWRIKFGCKIWSLFGNDEHPHLLIFIAESPKDLEMSLV